MEILDKNTLFKIKIETTNDTLGLNKSDKWCNITIQIENKEINYKLQNKILTKKEITKITEQIEKQKKEKIKKVLKFIKNFITIKLYNIKNTRYLEIKIIKYNNKNNYKIIFKNEEIDKLQTKFLNYK